MCIPIHCEWNISPWKGKSRLAKRVEKDESRPVEFCELNVKLQTLVGQVQKDGGALEILESWVNGAFQCERWDRPADSKDVSPLEETSSCTNEFGGILIWHNKFDLVFFPFCGMTQKSGDRLIAPEYGD